MSSAVVEKVRLALRSDGLGGTVRRVARRGGAYLALSESHIWFALDLSAERPRPPLAPELTLVRAEKQDLRLLEQLRTLLPGEARARIDAGNELWLVLDGDHLLFSSWLFRGQTPVMAAPGGQLPLPSDIVCMEDSEAAPAARGRGIGAAALAAVADGPAAEGKHWVITKITPDNKSSQRLAEKVGFEAVALMRFRRRGPRSRTWLEPLDAPGASSFVERVGPGLIDGRASR